MPISYEGFFPISILPYLSHSAPSILTLGPRIPSAMSCETCFGIIWGILTLGGMLLSVLVCAQKSRTIHHRLLSTLALHMPVSGFYGPGSWWAWLITLGMSHVHMARALLRTGSVPLKWDFDLHRGFVLHSHSRRRSSCQVA
ncbi:hypothetical protein K438DRAFT_1795971 [Mycena galopus ATCC 62051]|nr:hypothetical protein K438DRAFT_1795971 [Mycena galopus ATCC 62051]